MQIVSVKRHQAPAVPTIRPRNTSASRHPTHPELSLTRQFLWFEGRHFKVMTYNLKQLHDPATTRPEKTRWFGEIRDLTKLAQVILLEKPDVLAVQEITNEETLRHFNEDYLGGYYKTIIVSPTAKDRSMHVGILATDELQVVCKQLHPSSLFKITQRDLRDLIEVTFRSPNGFEFTVMNAHWKAMRPSESDTYPIRLKEAQAARKIITQALQKDPKKAIILTGDLNLQNSPLGQSIVNLLKKVDPKFPEYTLTEATTYLGTERPTHRSNKGFGEQKLDYSFLTRSLLSHLVNAEIKGDFKAEPWAGASDHLPLITTIDDDPTTPPMYYRSVPSIPLLLLTPRMASEMPQSCTDDWPLAAPPITKPQRPEPSKTTRQKRTKLSMFA